MTGIRHRRARSTPPETAGFSRSCAPVCWTLPLFLFLWGQPASAGTEDEDYLALPEVFDSRPFLRHERPSYNNFAFETYLHHADHSHSFENIRGVGFQNRPRAFHSRFGDYLITGYDLYSWEERRQPEQVTGSSLFKDWTSWHYVFDQLIVGHDSYRSWGYSLIVGDALIARLSPLTLSKTDFSGARVDLSTPYFKVTTMASRIARPNHERDWAMNLNTLEEHTTNSTMLLGSRAQADIGALQIGLNGANLHTFHALGTDNSMKGIVRPDHPLFEALVVRFTDDSPRDGKDGALVQQVELIIDGVRRPDIRPGVLRHRAGTATQVGRSVGSGFQRVVYNRFGGIAPRYYRDQEIPLYADYLYRLAHEDPDFLLRLQNGDSKWLDRNAGFVEKNTNLEGLLSTFVVESPDDVLAADGTDALVFVFDLSGEPRIESVRVEAIVGNDYRVELAKLYQFSDKPGNLDVKYRSTTYETVLRADGNVRDQSNVERRGFRVGVNTSIFTYSADLHLGLPGLEITGEYARSATFARFPSHVEGTPDFHSGPRFSDRSSASFLNATSWFGRGRVGFELFAMNPDFTTDMVTYLPSDLGYRRRDDPFLGLEKNTMVWRLVQDNEDGDLWPDLHLGQLLGSPGTRKGCQTYDCDGVFPGQDADNDGIADTNRNLNSVPDYEEPFLMYDVEPNDFAYGMDRNNNDEPDIREDDYAADYPYDNDQRGYHLFGQYDLTLDWTVGIGRHDVEGIASGGRNTSTYAILTYQRQGLERLRQVFFENHFRRVQDDIPDEYNRIREDIELFLRDGYETAEDGLPNVLTIGNPMITRPDLLHYEDSYVNESYLEGHWRPRPSLNVVQKLRLRLNWQQGGPLPSGTFQRDRRLDQWNIVSRADYTRYWGSLKVQPQFKFMLLRLRDQRAERSLRSEVNLIPILQAEYPLMSRSTLQVGIQGIGPFPYRFRDRAAERHSFERRTKFANVTNRSSYFGYQLFTIIGLTKDNRDYDDDSQRFREFDSWSFFIRALVGFTQYGRPL